MAWYSAGTVSVTNGSKTITGSAAVDFVKNAFAGDAFALIGGSIYEIASVDSRTQLTLARPWLGANANDQSYVIQPTVGNFVDIAQRALAMLSPFQVVLDGIGQGLIPAGTVAAPGVRFSADQDTGIRRVAENVLALVAGGVDRLFVDANGARAPHANLTDGPQLKERVRLAGAEFYQGNYDTDGLGCLIGVNRPSNRQLWLADTARLAPNATNPTFWFGLIGSTVTLGARATDGVTSLPLNIQQDSGATNFGPGLVTTGGQIIAGARVGNGAAPSAHLLARAGFGSGAGLLAVDNGASTSLLVQSVNGTISTANPSALLVGRNTDNGRGISTPGTINASGADYAEYMVKCEGCGEIAKGDVVGVDRNGRLTRRWADALSFVVKSTDPALVGGDAWGGVVGEPPQEPGEAPLRPQPPSPPVAPAELLQEPEREDGEEEIDFIRRMATWMTAALAAPAALAAHAAQVEAYQQAVATYADDAARYPAEAEAYAEAVAAYERDLPAWRTAMEAARKKVDRIAFSGQVPVNVDAETLAACEAARDSGEAIYLVAVARGGGIGAAAVTESDMTLPLYMRRVGKVWAIRDGRPWIDVQHG